MLVMSRMVGESIQIGETVLVTFEGVTGRSAADLRISPSGGAWVDDTIEIVSKSMKRDEAWDILPGITIYLVELSQGPPQKVWLGISCPAGVSIRRPEVRQEVIRRDLHRDAE